MGLKQGVECKSTQQVVRKHGTGCKRGSENPLKGVSWPKCQDGQSSGQGIGRREGLSWATVELNFTSWQYGGSAHTHRPAHLPHKLDKVCWPFYVTETAHPRPCLQVRKGSCLMAVEGQAGLLGRTVEQAS